MAQIIANNNGGGGGGGGGGTGDMLKSVYDPNLIEADAFDYNNFINTPTIPAAQVQSDWDEEDNTKVDYIKNKPTIPTDTSDLTNDAGYITGITSSDVTNALGYTPYSDANPSGYTSNTGDVVGPNSSSDGNVVLFDGVTGKIIQDSGIPLSSKADVSALDNYIPYNTTATPIDLTAQQIYSAKYEDYLDPFINGINAIDLGAGYVKISANTNGVESSARFDVYNDKCEVYLKDRYTDNGVVYMHFLDIYPDKIYYEDYIGGVTSNKTYEFFGGGANQIATLGDLSGFITGITSSDVIDALGYTPYDSSNPDGFTSNTGDVEGPASSTDGDLVLFDGVTGKLIKDSSKSLSDLVQTSGTQTVNGTKTFGTSPVVPSKTTAATNSGTSIATEAQVKLVADDVATINGMISSNASSSNKLMDKNYIDDSINSVTAYYITKNAQGDQFATYAELAAATTFYSGGVQRTPTRNDYTIVLADENHDNATTRYIYNSGWEYQYTVNETALSQAQLDALNSGITSGKVSTYDGYASTIAGKQDALTSQTAYTNQGSATKVPQITTNTLGQVTGITEVSITYPAQEQSDWNEADNTKVDYIKNKPTIPTDTSDLTNNAGFITGITSGDVTAALGYTPYSDANPSGYTSNTGDVVGPASSTDGNVALFDGATGKLIKDSGTLLSNKADASDLNVKTFTLSGTTGAAALAEAQAIYDWFADGNYPQIYYNDKFYILDAFSQFDGSLLFINILMVLNSTISNSYNEYKTFQETLEFEISSDTVVAINYNYSYPTIKVLATDVNYSSPYTPAYNGSPATKKYVDDTKPLSGSGAPSSTPTFVGQEYVDTTNEKLYVANGTSSSSDWKEVGGGGGGGGGITNDTTGTTSTISAIWVGTETEFTNLGTKNSDELYLTFP